METEKLNILKKELAGLPQKKLAEILLRIARLKKENKELLHYLLYEAEDPLYYAEKIKKDIEVAFSMIDGNAHKKTLRKILRAIGKYARFTASKHGETELLIYFLRTLLEHKGSLQGQAQQLLVYNVFKKISAAIPKLHEDLQYDYVAEYNKLAEVVNSKLSFWNKGKYGIPMI